MFNPIKEIAEIVRSVPLNTNDTIVSVFVVSDTFTKSRYIADSIRRELGEKRVVRDGVRIEITPLSEKSALRQICGRSILAALLIEPSESLVQAIRPRILPGGKIFEY